MTIIMMIIMIKSDYNYVNYENNSDNYYDNRNNNQHNGSSNCTRNYTGHRTASGSYVTINFFKISEFLNF